VEEKIGHLSRKKALLDDYKIGCMQQLFSHEIRFKDDEGGDFKNWKEKRLGEISFVFSGGTPSSKNTDFYNGEIPFIGSGDINRPSVEQYITSLGLKSSSAKMVNKGDLLYALYGATSGEVAISQISGAINQAVLCIRTNQIGSFIYQWLRYSKSSIVSTFLQGGQGNLSGKIVKELKILLPQLDEQRKIADFLSAIDRKIDLVDQELTLARSFKAGLLQQMFV
jgi:type I restriction enzyme S subunit